MERRIFQMQTDPDSRTGSAGGSGGTPISQETVNRVVELYDDLERPFRISVESDTDGERVRVIKSGGTNGNS